MIKKKKKKSIAIRISVLLCGTGCRPPNDSKPQNKTSIFRSHEFIVRVLTLLAATFSLIVFNHRLVRFVLHEKSVRVSIALEHNHPQSKGTNSTELILDSCSELLLDQYTASTKDQTYPSWPFPLTGLLQALGCLSEGHFLLLLLHQNPKLPPALFCV